MKVIRHPGFVLDTCLSKFDEIVYMSSSSMSLNWRYCFICCIGVSTFFTDDDPGMTAFIVIYLSRFSCSLVMIKSREITIF